MTINHFNSLSDRRKKEIIVDAEKVAEYHHELEKYELFKIDRFFVEVKVCFLKRYRIITNTFFRKDLPLVYSGKV